MLSYKMRAKVAHHLINQGGVAGGAEFLLFAGAGGLFTEFSREQHPVVNPKQALEQQIVLQYVYRAGNSNAAETAGKPRWTEGGGASRETARARGGGKTAAYH